MVVLGVGGYGILVDIIFIFGDFCGVFEWLKRGWVENVN